MISWGVGTEAATLFTSEFLNFINTTLYQLIIATQNYTLNDVDYKNFKDHFFENPDETLFKLREIYSTEFCEIVEEAIKVYPDIMRPDVKKVIKSRGPDIHGNISALCLSGKKVFHKRMNAEEAEGEPYYRYVLNIYFDSDSLPQFGVPRLRVPRLGGNIKMRKTRKRSYRRSIRKSKYAFPN